MKSRSDALKATNIKWLVMLAMLDGAAVGLFIAPELVSAGSLAIIRAGATAVLPVVVVMLSGLLSHEVKATLVFWKIVNPLPGSRAFTEYGPSDARIDMKALTKNVGVLPEDPREQNAKWYKLYRLVADDAAVSHAHKLYLMYRDMAAISFILASVIPAALWYIEVALASRWTAGGLLVLQYVACAIGARHSGVRFICNVMAIHSTKKVKA